MSTRRNLRIAWPQRILCVMVASLALLTSVTLTAGGASAAPPNKSTTTTAPTSTSGKTGSGGAASPKLTAVVSLSRHRALATYDRDLDAAALEVSSYLIYSTQAVNLSVTAVSRASQNQAFIITGPQEPVTYRMEKPKTPRPVTFTGSSLTEPKLLSVRPLSTTQIIVSFSEPVGSSALQPSAYQITVEGSTAALTVSSAALFGSTGKEVLLTTGPQEALPYLLKVGDIQGTSGTYMDPTATTMQFSGSTVLPGPMLLNATADGNTRVVLTFDSPLDPSSATNPANYTATPNLFIQSATLQSENRQVVLTTGPQYQADYSLMANVTGANGNPVNPGFNAVSFKGSGEPINNERPKVTSAASTGNTTVVVQFSKPMADNTADPARFAIVQTVVHPEVGTLVINGAQFVDSSRLSVRLTTSSQAEVTYQVTANNVTDLMGNPLADRVTTNGVLVDPTSFTFPGTPPTGSERVDSDGDGVYDHEETRGWVVTVKLATAQTTTTTNSDGTTTTTQAITTTRQVTSSPYSPDTDGDDVGDYQEKSLTIDPRDDDTDDDELNDNAEFNQIFSDPTVQDTDGDSLYDGLEVKFFGTSAILDDTDGDQIVDGTEITLANRNAKVADLPKPTLEISDMTTALDVRFVDSIGGVETEVDKTTETGTLTQSAKKEYSNSNSVTIEAGMKYGQKENFGVEVGSAKVSVSAGFESSFETSYSGSFTTSFSQTSSEETSKAYERSLETTKERSRNANQTREVSAARVQANVMIKSGGDIAFRIKNLQVTAHVQDPQQPDRLTPLATLLPEGEPADGFSLGPLVATRGPVVFKSDTVFPKVLEDLMENPRGVVFRFSNFDVVDEQGRNFAFTSQDVNDRTARLVIDYGGHDQDGDGQGDYSEILRVATGTGRRIVDTDKDGDVDGDDLPIVYDADGKHVGISLREALQAAGLTELKEVDDPTDNLTDAQIRNSYSLVDIPGVGERLFRVRHAKRELPQTGAAKEWQIITPTGINPAVGLDDVIMSAGQSVNLSFVQDLDRDGLTAVVERLNNCSDVTNDHDSDGLDDRFETLIGWTVDTDQGQFRVRSRCASSDTDNDGLTDRAEAPGVIQRNAAGLVLFEKDGEKPGRTSRAIFEDVGSEAAMLALPAHQGDLARRTDIVGEPNSLFTLLSETPTDPASWARFSGELPTGTTYSRFESVASEAAMVALPAHRGDLARRTDLDGGGQHPLFILTTDDPTVAASWVRLTREVSSESPTALLVRPRLVDPVTDPSGKDTDQDDLDDKHEGTAHVVTLYDGKLTRPLITSAELEDTDLDTAPDGYEERVGGDPTVFDIDNFSDADGDGLTNLEERLGWLVWLEEVSTTATTGSGTVCDSVCKEGGFAERRVTSNANDSDTDDDGLSDGEERNASNPERLNSSIDPTSKDTDADGLTDFAEVKGYTHGAFGILSTDPGDADSDNDKRTDGAEVKDGIIVRLPNENPYQTFSNPTKPDADWDRLVDGDEARVGTDAAKFNTDGDNRSDYSEVVVGRRPLVPDLRVTMNFSRLHVAKGGDGDGDDGDYDFRLYAGHRRSDGTDFHTLAAHSWMFAVDQVPPLPIPNCGSTSPCRQDVHPQTSPQAFGPEDFVISVRDGVALPLARTAFLGSVSTTEQAFEQIEVRGYLTEGDGDNPPHGTVDCRLDFPDLFGEAANGTGVVRGPDLKPGTTSMAVHRTATCPIKGQPLDVTLMVSYTAD